MTYGVSLTDGLCDYRDFVREKDVTFDLVTINPPLVIGENLDKVEDPAHMNESSTLVCLLRNV